MATAQAEACQDSMHSLIRSSTCANSGTAMPVTGISSAVKGSARQGWKMELRTKTQLRMRVRSGFIMMN